MPNEESVAKVRKQVGYEVDVDLEGNINRYPDGRPVMVLGTFPVPYERFQRIQKEKKRMASLRSRPIAAWNKQDRNPKYLGKYKP